MTATPSFLLKLLQCPSLGRVALKPEEALSIELANRLRAHALAGRLKCIWVHCPNEGKRSRRYGAVQRAMGLIAGAPDYLFMGAHRNGAIEMKAGGGRQTGNQKNFEEWCWKWGVPYVVCFQANEAEVKLREWGLLQ